MNMRQVMGSRRAHLWILFLIGTSSYIDKNILTVLAEPIKLELGLSDARLGLLSGLSFALFYVSVGIPVARWADTGNRKIVIFASLGIWSVMTLCCGVAKTFWQLAVARVGVGAGEGGILPTSQSLLADYYPPDERGKAIGIFMMSSAVGYAIAAIGGSYLAELYGWRATFLGAGMMGFLLIPLCQFGLKEPRRLQVGTTDAASRESIRVAIRKLAAKPAYRNLLGAMILYYFTSNGMLTFTVPLLMRVHGMRVSEAGFGYGVAGTLGAIIGTIVGGMLADRLVRIDVKWLGRLSALGMLAAVPFYEVAFRSTQPYVTLFCLLLAISMIAIAVPPMFSALHVVCGSKRRALAVAIALFFANLLGFGFGPVAVGSLSDVLGAWGADPATSLQYALMTTAPVLVAVACLLNRTGRSLAENTED